MANIRIVTDTAHNLPEDIAREIPMVEVPFKVRVGEDEYDDNDLTLADLARLLERRKGRYPSTSAPPPYDFQQIFRASKNFDGVVVITIGSAYSAACNNALQAVETFRDQTKSKLPIEVVDSRGGTMNQGFLVMEANELLVSGRSLRETAEKLRESADKDKLVFALKETTYLYRSGRAKRVQHLLASILRVKPVLALNNGELALLDRIRGDIRKAYQRVVEEVLTRSNGVIEKLAIIGGLGTEEGEEYLLGEILSRLSVQPREILHAKMCPAIMVHVGPHGVGAAWV
ncbi:MAG TPA: DegV family protein [Candidatus Nanoarchaeia archaeon]